MQFVEQGCLRSRILKFRIVPATAQSAFWRIIKTVNMVNAGSNDAYEHTITFVPSIISRLISKMN